MGAIGFDINKHAIAIAKTKYPDTKFYRHDIATFGMRKLVTSRPHALVCLNVIEHLPDAKRHRFMSSIIPKLIRSRGIVIFSLQRQYYLPNWVNSLLQRGTLFDPTHVVNWTIDEFVREVGRYFHIQKCINVSGYTKYPNLLQLLKSETLIVARLKKRS